MLFSLSFPEKLIRTAKLTKKANKINKSQQVNRSRWTSWASAVSPRTCGTSISNCVPRLSVSRNRWPRTTSRGSRCTSGNHTLDTDPVLPLVKMEVISVIKGHPINSRRMIECVNYIRNNPQKYSKWDASDTARLFSPSKFENKKEAKEYWF